MASTADIALPARTTPRSGFRAVARELRLYQWAKNARHDVRKLYSRPGYLWFLCPLALYWLSHAWLRTRRGELDDDPLVFALRDVSSWTVLAIAGAILWAGV